jgi:hypothetical protein
MNNLVEKAKILNDMARIQRMERGTISRVIFKDRSPQAGPYFKLQYWEQGKNHTRHVPPEHLEMLQEAVEGYATFQDLAQQYAELVMAETRSELQQLPLGVKKKNPAQTSSWPRTKKSNR